jgi:hypothetical protein
MPHRVLDTFDRVLVLHNTKIQSTCQNCGFVIVSSVSEGLQNQEVEHAQQCPKRRAASS